jgi:hypothetical protein
LCNAHIRFGEQSSGALDSSIQHIAMRRQTRGRVKRSKEMTAAVANCRREFLKGQIRIQTALNQFLNTRQFASSESRRSACLPRPLTQEQEAHGEGVGE